MEIRKPKTFRLPVHSSDWIFLAANHYLYEPKLEKIRTLLRDKRHSISSTTETYRIINSWGEAGLLLEDDQKRESGWRKFSPIDLCWIAVLRELRNLGFPREKLLRTRESLFLIPEDEDKPNTGIFEMYIARVLNKDDVQIIVTPSGQAGICREQELQFSDMFLPSTYITLSFNKLIAEVSRRPELGSKNKFLRALDKKEEEVLDKIRSDSNLTEVIIKTQDNKITRTIFKNHTQNPEQALTSIKKAMKEGGHREVKLVIHQGKAVLLEETEKT